MEQIRMEQLNTRLKLFVLWLFVLLNIIFRDIHQMTMKSHLEMLLTGYYNGMPVTDTVMLIGFFVVNIPIGMLLVSLFVNLKRSRVLNLIAASLMPLILLTSPPSDMDDIAHLSIELVAIGGIIWSSVRWKTDGEGITKTIND